MSLRLYRMPVAVALLALAVSANAGPRFEEDFDDQEKPWQEIEVQLPPAPPQENLASFYVSPTATTSFSVDTGSISVGTDGVIRYTMVAISEAGAKNISYEGIRCATFERKLYAFGRPDGSWSRSRRDQWEPIARGAMNRQHAALAKDYFCSEKTIAGSADDMAKRLRYKRPLAP